MYYFFTMCCQSITLENLYFCWFLSFVNSVPVVVYHHIFFKNFAFNNCQDTSASSFSKGEIKGEAYARCQALCGKCFLFSKR